MRGNADDYSQPFQRILLTTFVLGNCNYPEPYSLFKMTFPNEKEKIKAEIQVLTKKLSLLEEMEKYKSPCEIAFKRVYGYFPTEPNWDDDKIRWENFQKGYNSAKKDYKVGEYQPTPLEKLQESNWYVDAKTLLKSNWEPKPQNENEVEQGLRDAMKTAQSEGVFDEPKPETLTLKQLLKKWEIDFAANWAKNRTSELYEEEVERFIQMFTEWMPYEINDNGLSEWDHGWNTGYSAYRNNLMRKLK